MDEQTELLREMRDLLRVIAEPALAQRDQRLRTALRETIGKSKLKAKAAVLMDGTRNQAVIRKEAGIDQAELSRLTKTLRNSALVTGENPKLTVLIPSNFFETDGD